MTLVYGVNEHGVYNNVQDFDICCYREWQYSLNTCKSKKYLLNCECL